MDFARGKMFLLETVAFNLVELAMSRESNWVLSFLPGVNKRLQVAARPGYKLLAVAGYRLPYSFEALCYTDGEPCRHHTSKYQTDVLICEVRGEEMYPRVVIECKIGGVSTHDALTYSTKAATHKNVHPHLRYGILLGDWGNHPLPKRLIRHGSHFDFMVTWKGETATPREWQQLMELLSREINASRLLQDLLTEHKKTKPSYSLLHRPLNLHLIRKRRQQSD